MWQSGTQAGRGLQPRPKRLRFRKLLRHANVSIGVANPDQNRIEIVDGL